MPPMGGWMYMMTNRPFGTLYVGVTNDIARRTWEHRQGTGSSFTSRYHLTRLVYMERHDDIRYAINRETRLKHWPRLWKLNLIEAQNPLWDDLFDRLTI
jgi:putative endonuclease